MLSIGVYTACIGPHTDRLKQPTVIAPGVRYFCATDRPEACADTAWQPINVPAGDRPTWASRQFKISLHEHATGCDYYVWVDAAFTLDVDPHMFAPMMMRSDLLAMTHPDRDRLEDEAAAIKRQSLAPPSYIDRQVADYRKRGLPDDIGLTATGLLVRRNCARVRKFNQTWLKAFDEAGHNRDQMSFDYARWLVSAEMRLLEGHYRGNPYCTFYPQRSRPCQPS